MGVLSRFSFGRPSFDWLPSPGRSFLLYAAYTLVLFLVFLIVNFPHHTLVQRALQSFDDGPFKLTVQGARFAWWRGYELQGVRLLPTHPGGNSPPFLESRSIYVRPGLGGLLRGEITSLWVESSLYDGVVDAGWTNGNGEERITVRFDSVELGRHPAVSALLEEGELSGRLSGVLTVEPRGRSITGSEAAGDIRLSGAHLSGARIRGMTVPDLSACSGDAKLSLKSGRLDVQALDLVCQELKLNLAGQVMLQDDPARSVLNLRIDPEPGLAATEQSKMLVQLIPRTVTGTLARPSWQLGTPTGRRHR